MLRKHRTAISHETKRLRVEMDTVKLDGRFSGYASIFGEPDDGGDVVERHAFRKSLEHKPANAVRMLFQHNPNEPIGRWTRINEDQKGLLVQGQITRGVQRCEEVLELMRSGALDGLSIGFKTRRAKRDAITGKRHIFEADLWEISVVTFPLLGSARINSVKNQSSESIPSVREFERWLTRDAGLSRRDARTVLATGYQKLACKREAARVEPLQNKLKRATQTILARN